MLCGLLDLINKSWYINCTRTRKKKWMYYSMNLSPLQVGSPLSEIKRFIWWQDVHQKERRFKSQRIHSTCIQCCWCAVIFISMTDLPWSLCTNVCSVFLIRGVGTGQTDLDHCSYTWMLRLFFFFLRKKWIN